MISLLLFAALGMVDVTQYGVIGDAQVATDCSITSGSGVVTCASPHFTPSDVGKSLGMWGAGPTVKAYVTALTTTIASYQSPTQITLVDNASNSANPSAHLVWGTNNFAAINAVLAKTSELYFPSGYYLTPTINFATATQNAIVSGASMASTVIENFKADRSAECSFYTCGLIMFSAPVSGVTIHDITLIEVQNGLGNFYNEPQNISLNNTSNSEVYRVNVQWSSYPCIAGGNEPAYIHDNYAYHCGWGGPAYSGTNSAFNVVVPNSKIVRNRVYFSAQGIEAGAPNQEISGNFLQEDDTKGNYPPYQVSPKRCLSIDSSTYGMWNVLVKGNTCVNWALGPTNGSSGMVGNTGLMNNVTVEDNDFINSGAFRLGDGGEGPTTGWPSGETTKTVHGTSIFKNNTFRYDANVIVGTQGLGLTLAAVKEKWVISNIDIILPGNGSNCTSCVGLWFPSPTVPAGSPTHVVNNLHIEFPPGATNTGFAIENPVNTIFNSTTVSGNPYVKTN